MSNTRRPERWLELPSRRSDTNLQVRQDHVRNARATQTKRLSKAQAGSFYAVHKDRPFFNNLISFMSSGPIVAAVLEKENAVDDFRTLLGATNPDEAAEGTIRKLFANSVGENAVHGSDSDENSLIETQFHFSQSEIFSEI